MIKFHFLQLSLVLYEPARNSMGESSHYNKLLLMGNFLRVFTLLLCVVAYNSFIVTHINRVVISSLKRASNKYDCELPAGFVGPKHYRIANRPKEPIVVGTLDELKDLIKQGL